MSVCVCVCVCVALVIRHAICVCHIVLCGLPRSTKFPHIISQTVGFSRGGEGTENTMFRISLQLLSDFHSKRKLSEIWPRMGSDLHAKHPLCLSDFNEAWIFSQVFFFFSKNTQISIFMKIRPVGSEMFRADGWTDMTRPTVVYRNSAKASKHVRPGKRYR